MTSHKRLCVKTHSDSMWNDPDAGQRPPVSKELLKWISREYFGELPSPHRWVVGQTQRSDMNGSSYRILDQPPSPLEFARLVHLSRPVVIKGISYSDLHWVNTASLM